MHIFCVAESRGSSIIPVVIFLLLGVSQAHSFEPAILVINIVTAGFYSSKFLSSLTYNLPALQLAVSDMQTKYGKAFQLNHIVLEDLCRPTVSSTRTQPASSCPDGTTRSSSQLIWPQSLDLVSIRFLVHSIRLCMVCKVTSETT